MIDHPAHVITGITPHACCGHCGARLERMHDGWRHVPGTAPTATPEQARIDELEAQLRRTEIERDEARAVIRRRATEDDVAEGYGVAVWADGTVRARGRIAAYSIVPMFLILGPDGERTWSREDMVYFEGTAA